MNTITDEEIIHYLKPENEPQKGFRLLIEKHQERLYAHIRRIVWSHQDTDDILQETFIKAFQNWHSFKGNAAIYTWLYRIATNEALRFIKKNRNRHDSPGAVESVDHLIQMEAATLIDEALIEKKFKEALKLLPPRQRVVFNLRYFEEMNYREISEILSTSEGSLKASYHHAMQKITQFLKKDIHFSS